jgi:hypothetical protein
MEGPTYLERYVGHIAVWKAEEHGSDSQFPCYIHLGKMYFRLGNASIKILAKTNVMLSVRAYAPDPRFDEIPKFVPRQGIRLILL